MGKPALIAIMAAGAALLLWQRKEIAGAVEFYWPDDDPEQNLLTEISDAIEGAIPVSQGQQNEAAAKAAQALESGNVRAFLWMIRVSEGTAGPEGYRTIVGGELFDNYGDHPRILVSLPNLGIKSSAAGAYQFIRRTWDGVAKKLGLVDFSPAAQDLAAVELIRQRGALADVIAGRFAVAVDRCKREWASLPGAGYGQHENSLARLQAAYLNAGGKLA